MKTETEDKYLAMFPHYWGRGATIALAIKQACAEGGRGHEYVVYEMPPGAIDPRVDCMGRISWTWVEGTTNAQREGDVVLVVDKRKSKGMGTAETPEAAPGETLS